jgi:nucleoside-diphosphate-sugar epimerase
MESGGSSSSSGHSGVVSAPVLVTGAGGYLGSRVVERLRTIRTGVIGLARNGNPDYRCDLLDLADVRRTLAATRPSVVVHCAAAVPRSSDGYDDTASSADNIRMVANLVAAGAEAVVFTSSMTVYGPGSGRPAKEEGPDPQSAYGRAKLEAERLLLAAPRCRAVVLRLPGLFGPPRRTGLVYALCDAIVRGRQPSLPPQPLMWGAIHVDDAAEMVVRSAMSKPFASNLLNVGYSQPLSVSLLLQKLNEMTGVRIQCDVPHEPFQMDLARMESVLGAAPGCLAGRLQEMLEYAREQ